LAGDDTSWDTEIPDNEKYVVSWINA